MTFAERLNQLRLKRGLSLQDVADAVGLSKAHVWNLEKGASGNPSIEVVLKLAQLFRVSVADLIGENPQSDAEEPEMVALFRDLKSLEPADRAIIATLMEQLRQRPKNDATEDPK